MIRRYNRLSLMWGVPGLVMSSCSMPILMLGDTRSEEAVLFAAAHTILGYALLIIGLSYYASAKKRHPAWGLLGLLSWAGIAVLAFMKDIHKQETERMDQGLCPACAYDLRHDLDRGCPECGWKREEADA